MCSVRHCSCGFHRTYRAGPVTLPCLTEVSGRLVDVCSALDRCEERGKVPCQLFLLTEQMSFSLMMFSSPARIPLLAFASSPLVALADQGPRAELLRPARQEPPHGKYQGFQKNLLLSHPSLSYWVCVPLCLLLCGHTLHGAGRKRWTEQVGPSWPLLHPHESRSLLNCYLRNKGRNPILCAPALVLLLLFAAITLQWICPQEREAG